MSQNIIDADLQPDDSFNHDEFDESDREAFAQAFADAGRPDVPLIDLPQPGVVKLSYGVEIDGERRKLVTVRELSGSDEEALGRLDPGKGDQYYILLMDLIIKRATETIGGVVPTPADLGRLLLGGRDIIFLEIILPTVGEEKPYEDVKCPDCGEVFSAHVTVRGVVDIHRLENEDQPYIEVALRDGSVAHLRYPIGDDQMALFQGKDVKRNPSERNTFLLGRCVESIDGKPIRNGVEFARNLGMADRRALVEALDKGPRVEFK